MIETALLHRPLMRLISLLLAIVLSVIILVYPQALIAADGTSQHGLLMVLLISISIGFIHGVGFAPRRKIWRETLGPLTSWPLMLFGLYYMLSN
jgi:predicted membrane protein